MTYRGRASQEVDWERLIVEVIAGGLTMAGDSNRARKNYSRYGSTSQEVLFNMPIVKSARTSRFRLYR